MKIKKIIIENFKFHHHLEFEIRNNNNCLIYGENGSGKSSIYEALYSNFYYYKNIKIANGIIKIRDTFLHRSFPSGDFEVNILFNNSTYLNRTDENLTNEGKRKKNYIWRVLLLVTAVGVALLPVIAWNMFVPDVLWAKIVTVVVCEGYVVFIVSMEIIQIKDELKEDMLKIGGYKITPKGSISLFKEIDFKIAQTEYSYTILISKKPLKWLYKKFYVTIYGRHGKVKKIELVRADKKYSTKYETMNGTVLEKLQEENNRFLRKCLGTPSKKSMTGVEYYYEWGQIQSFYDDRSCQTGIVIMF